MKPVSVLLVFVAGLFSVPAFAQKCSSSIPTVTCEDNGKLVIVGVPADSRSEVRMKEVDVFYGNKLRYDLGPQTTQTPIGAATVPALLAPSSAAVQKTAAITPAKSDAGAPQTPVGPDRQALSSAVDAKSCDQTDSNWPTTKAEQSRRITNCWTFVRNAVADERGAVLQLRNDINDSIRDAGNEQRCYQLQMSIFRTPILITEQANALTSLAVANRTLYNPSSNSDSCRRPEVDWPFDAAEQVSSALVNQQRALSDLVTAPGYDTWITESGHRAANDLLVKQVADLLTEATTYTTGAVTLGAGAVVTQTYNDLMEVERNNKLWRAQLMRIASKPVPDNLEVQISVDPCRVWYGKGRTDTIKLHAIDLYSTTAASSDISLATNTCLPLTIASTGVGVSFLANPTYAFVPLDNTGTQGIGVTATNDQSPLYSVLYNVKLMKWKPAERHGVELFASPGVGLVTASSTTTSDFLGGVSVSFARRVLFVTPALDFGQRNRLADGFSLKTPKGLLTSVPTVSRWQAGFMLSISIGIGPS